MNAYELADELENYVWMNPNNNRDYCKEVKDMLRQQADRIAELEKQCSEPVAWLWIHNGATMNALLRNPSYDERSKENWVKKGWISKPLYTTPQIKELDKSDIYAEALQAGIMLSTQYGQSENKLMPVSDGDTLVKFARAILKKASNK